MFFTVHPFDKERYTSAAADNMKNLSIFHDFGLPPAISATPYFDAGKIQ